MSHTVKDTVYYHWVTILKKEGINYLIHDSGIGKKYLSDYSVKGKMGIDRYVEVYKS